MNLSDQSRIDKELFSGERSSYENTEMNMNVSIDSSLYYGDSTCNNIQMLH
jgi:hypothetical protein